MTMKGVGHVGVPLAFPVVAAVGGVVDGEGLAAGLVCVSVGGGACASGYVSETWVIRPGSGGVCLASGAWRLTAPMPAGYSAFVAAPSQPAVADNKASGLCRF